MFHIDRLNRQYALHKGQIHCQKMDALRRKNAEKQNDVLSNRNPEGGYIFRTTIEDMEVLKQYHQQKNHIASGIFIDTQDPNEIEPQSKRDRPDRNAGQ